MTKVEAKHDVLLASLQKYYEDTPGALDTLRDILGGKTRMSLRVLDWLVTNYSKKKNIVYPIKLGGEDTAFNLFMMYKSQLKAYSKRFFDPFCRRGRVSHNGLETTCGQLNFFRWAIQYKVLEYARDNHDEIEQDMLASIQHRYGHGTARASTASDTKRKELSKAAIKTCTTTLVKVKVKFS